SGRSDDLVEVVGTYAKAEGMWRRPGDEPVFTSTLELDMGDVQARLAGPKRPQDRVALGDLPTPFAARA
ncbi:aconitase family protein, partial [Salmonella enterica]|uniref:aconitase family protein n=1 Tax=Salmonella enterica TaxID=28901 RepID=UPI003EDB7D1F